MVGANTDRRGRQLPRLDSDRNRYDPLSHPLSVPPPPLLLGPLELAVLPPPVLAHLPRRLLALGLGVGPRELRLRRRSLPPAHLPLSSGRIWP